MMMYVKSALHLVGLVGSNAPYCSVHHVLLNVFIEHDPVL